MTGYFVRLPKNKIELFMWLESDRFNNPVFREFYSERDVVREERRRGVESTPTGLIEEDFRAMFWKSSSYHWDVIGWPSDLGSITREQANSYFDTYYAPNNLTMILVGDLDPDEMIKMVQEVLRAHPARQGRTAGRRDPRGEAVRREAADRRGGDQPAGRDLVPHRGLEAPGQLSAARSWPGS